MNCKCLHLRCAVSAQLSCINIFQKQNWQNTPNLERNLFVLKILWSTGNPGRSLRVDLYHRKKTPGTDKFPWRQWSRDVSGGTWREGFLQRLQGRRIRILGTHGSGVMIFHADFDMTRYVSDGQRVVPLNFKYKLISTNDKYVERKSQNHEMTASGPALRMCHVCQVRQSSFKLNQSVTRSGFYRVV